MLTMRAQQMEAFQASALTAFENEMVKHAALYFPNHLAIQGEASTRKVIRLGVWRAAGHGLSGRSDVCRYLNLMWMFGSYFDLDPLLPWAGAALRPSPSVVPTTCIQRAASRALDVFDHTSGPEHAYFNRALLRLQQLLDEPGALSPFDNGAARLADLLAALYPARYATLEPPQVEALFASAVETGRQHGLDGPDSSMLLALTMFYAGSGCVDDPQHDWLAGALAQVPAQRHEALLGAARQFVAQWLTRRD